MSQTGFFDENGKLFGPKNHLKIPSGKVVKITFVFDEAVNTLAIGDTHQITMVADDGWSLDSEKIWMFNKKTSIQFLAGEDGRIRYRGYCNIDCLGMAHLNNLIIEVNCAKAKPLLCCA